MKNILNPKSTRFELVLVLLLVIGVFAWQQFRPSSEKVTYQEPQFIPAPRQVQYFPGEFSLNASTQILFSSSLDNEKEYLKNWILEDFKLSLVAEEQKLEEKQNVVMLSLSPGEDKNPEAYDLYVDQDHVEIIAANPAGIFYGIQTLRQMMDRESLIWPACHVKDSPQYVHRGMLLDCSRHFMEPDFVKRYIDLLSYHKMNRLHWHLMDDQGWRLEIKSREKLSTMAAYRANKDGQRYGDFYTQDEIRDIVAYAEQRHVQIIPEIEMPGHCQAALHAYPEISCTGGPHEVWNEWGVSREIYCAGKEETFEFVFDVLDEVCELFPSKQIHLGGDEVPVYRWENCMSCQRRVAEEGLESEEELLGYFINRVAAYLDEKGREVIAWDEVAEIKNPPANLIVTAWRGQEKIREVSEKGIPVIACPTSHAYLDYSIDQIDLEKVFHFNPSQGVIDKDLILGAQVNMWSERAPQELIDSKVFPRILGMAELTWTGTGERSFQDFQAALQSHYDLLDYWGVDYGLESLPFKYQVRTNSAGWLDVLFEAANDVDVYFELQGDNPDSNSIYYEPKTEITVLDGEQEIRAQAYRRDRAYGGPYVRSFHAHQGVGKNIKLESEYSDNYSGGGDEALIDGRLGTSAFRDGIWQGYFGEDLVATIDLGEAMEIDTLLANFYQYTNSWIFLAASMELYAGLDEQNMSLLGQVSSKTSMREQGPLIETLKLTTDPTSARYIRIIVRNLGECPSWHDAAGEPAWLFMDELIIR